MCSGTRRSSTRCSFRARPQLTHDLLAYRYRRLMLREPPPRAAGLPGAMFPGSPAAMVGRNPYSAFQPDLWEPGLPTTPICNASVGLAIAYSVIQLQPLVMCHSSAETGGELLIEIRRFFAALAVHDLATTGSTSTQLWGPDEFHDGYPANPAAECATTPTPTSSPPGCCTAPSM